MYTHIHPYKHTYIRSPLVSLPSLPVLASDFFSVPPYISLTSASLHTCSLLTVLQMPRGIPRSTTTACTNSRT